MPQEINFNIGSDGGSAPVSDASQTVCVLGVSSAGTPATVYSIGSPTGLAALGSGPLVEACRHQLETGGQPCLAIPLTSSAGTIGTVIKTGTGVVLPTLTALAAGPYDSYSVAIKITVGGVVGTAKYQISFDGGATYEPESFTAASVPRAVEGLTLAFPAGTYVAGDLFTSACVAPSFNAAALNAAIDAAIATAYDFGILYIVGEATGADDATKAAASAALVSAAMAKQTTAYNAKRPFRVVLEAPNVADAALITAFASVTGTDNLSANIIAAWGAVISPISGRQPIVNLGRTLAAKLARKPIGKDPSAYSDGVGTGPLPATVLSITRDERKTPGLDPQRFVTSKTFVGRPGFYLEGFPLLSQSGSRYQWIQHGQIMDRALVVARAALLPWLSRSLDQKTDGSGLMTEGQAVAIESEVESAIKDAIVVPKHASALRAVLDRTIPVSAGFVLKLRVVPRAYAKVGNVDHALTLTLPVAS